jgi:hexosaminidase
LTQLSNAVPIVQRQMQASPRLAEVSMRADQLLQLTDMGQAALQYLANGQQATAGWKAKQVQILGDTKKPSALVRFTFLPSLNDLVQAVSEGAVPGGE